MIICQEKLKVIKPNDHAARFKTKQSIAVYSSVLTFTGQPTDHKRSISLLRECLSTCVDNSQRVGFLLALSLALAGDPKNLEDSIALQREAYSLDAVSSQYFLGRSLLERYRRFKDPGDLEESIQLFCQSVAVKKAKKSNWTMEGSTLADAILEVYMASGCQDIQHLEKAISIWRDITHDPADQDYRWNSVQNWAKQAHLHHHHSALEAYTMAIEFLPQLTTVDKDLDTRNRDLEWNGLGFAGDSASFALAYGSPDMAVEFLETARAGFWSQYLNLRTPLKELEVVSPELAGQIAQISTDLTQSSFRKNELASFAMPWSQTMIDIEKENARSRRLKEHWDATLDHIRSTILGFENFLQPKKFHQLQQAASRGPVILLTSSGVDNMCHALLVTHASLQHITLPISHLEARALAAFFWGVFSGSEMIKSMDFSLLESLYESSLDRNTRLKLKPKLKWTKGWDTDSSDVFCLVLIALWKKVVTPIIHTLQLKVSTS